jgi:hypothetical protein
MGIKAFAEAATLLFPELRVAAVEDVEFLAPFKLYRDEPRTLTLEMLLRREAGEIEEVVADARLLGRRRLPGQDEQVTVHFKARVRLVPALPVAADEARVHVPVDGNGHSVLAEDIYRVYFHGPAYQVMSRAWRDGDGVAGRFSSPLPPDHRPEEAPMLMAPRLIELCFQTAGIGELGTRGRMALPLRVAKVTALRRPDGNGTPLYAMTRPGDGEGAVDAYVVDGEGNLYLSLSGYRTIALPGGIAEERIAPLRAAMEARP